MIADWMFELIASILNGLYGLLPSWTIDMTTLGGASNASILDGSTVVTNNLSPFMMVLLYMRRYNTFVPFDQLVLICNFIVLTVSVILAYKLIRWIVGLVRGAGTS